MTRLYNSLMEAERINSLQSNLNNLRVRFLKNEIYVRALGRADQAGEGAADWAGDGAADRAGVGN